MPAKLTGQDRCNQATWTGRRSSTYAMRRVESTFPVRKWHKKRLDFPGAATAASDPLPARVRTLASWL